MSAPAAARIPTGTRIRFTWNGRQHTGTVLDCIEFHGILRYGVRGTTRTLYDVWEHHRPVALPDQPSPLEAVLRDIEGATAGQIQNP